MTRNLLLFVISFPSLNCTKFHFGAAYLSAVNPASRSPSRWKKLRINVAQDEFNDVMSKVFNEKSQKQRRTRRHDEAIATAAGVEQFFCWSIWSLESFLLQTYSVRMDPGTKSIASANSSHIDCEWACHSKEEMRQLFQVKRILQQYYQYDYRPINNSNHQIYPDVYGDLRLLRFLRKSKNKDISLTAGQYHSFIKWRKDNNVDVIRAMIEDSDIQIATRQCWDHVEECLPCNFEGVSSCSFNAKVKPVILHIGSFDAARITSDIQSSNISLNSFLEYWIYQYELIHYHLYQKSIATRQLCFIDIVCDLEGLSRKQLSVGFLKILRPWIKMTQRNYPETVRTIYLLNSPRIISLAWRWVAPMLSQGTLDKVKLVAFDGTVREFCEESFIF